MLNEQISNITGCLVKTFWETMRLFRCSIVLKIDV